MKCKKFYKPSVFIIGILGLFWLSAALLLYIFQDQVLYSPQSLSAETIQRINNTVKGSREIYLKSGNVRLHGWLVGNEQKPDSPLIIYFGGQGDEISPHHRSS